MQHSEAEVQYAIALDCNAEDVDTIVACIDNFVTQRSFSNYDHAKRMTKLARRGILMNRSDARIYDQFIAAYSAVGKTNEAIKIQRLLEHSSRTKPPH